MRSTHSIAFGFTILAAAAPQDCSGGTGGSGGAGGTGGAGGNYGITVNCRAVNDFGYVATASGNVQFTSRTQPSVLSTSGTLTVNTHLFGNPDNVRSITVQGTTDMFGQSFSGDVLSGAADLESFFFSFRPNGFAEITSRDTIQYQTECSQSVPRLPPVADLVLSGALHFSTLSDGKQRARIDVSNAGNTAVTGASTRLRVAGLDVTGSLRNAADTSNTLPGGEAGFIQVDLPASTLARCGSYAVILDLDHTLQSGPFDPFSNDSGQASTPCLRWNTPMTDEVLGVTAVTLIQFKTLEAIVSSQTIARGDNNLCSACHFAGSGKPYSPTVGIGITIAPSQVINGKSWAQAGGWADVFIAQPASVKPDYLKQAFQRWRDDGAQ